MKKSKFMRPRDVKGLDNICKLRSDNKTSGDFWILLDGRTPNSVTLCAQKNGEASTSQISIPKRHFNKMVDWYMRGQQLRHQK